MSIEARFSARHGAFSLNAEFTVPATGVTALYGASGAGKTMILRAVAGLSRYASGRLRVGEDTWQGDGMFLPPHRRPLGYVFQEASLLDHLSVRGNIAYGHRRVPPADRRVSLDRVIELFGLGQMLDRRPETLSGGERQRVAMARALAASPRLLLMDEPLTGLDGKRKREILPYLDALVRELEIPVLYVSHDADEVARLADYLVYIEQGRVVATGPIADLLTHLDLPLSRGYAAEALIEARAVDFDEEYGLNTLEFPGGKILAPGSRLVRGNLYRLRVAARDVSLTLSKPEGTSILNILPARVEQFESFGDGQAVVRLSIEEVGLLAHVTRKSLKNLGLAPGSEVFAQVKSVAVLT